MKAQRKSATKTSRASRARLLQWLRTGMVLLCCLGAGSGWSQELAPTISRIDIRYVGPSSLSETLIRANIRSRVGEPYRPITVNDDIQSLYSTDLIYNIRVTQEAAEDGGVILTYVIQANPLLVDVQLEGNEKIKESKLRKKITSKVGEALDERKLFTDARDVQKYYESKGYPDTRVEVKTSVDEGTGRGTATFVIEESPEVKIVAYEFPGAETYRPRELRRAILGWWRYHFSWLVGYGRFKDEKFEVAQDKLKEFYRDQGYIDFDLKQVEFEAETPRRRVIRFHVYEGQQYRVGNISFEGTTMLPVAAAEPDYDPGKPPESGADRQGWSEAAIFNRDFKMKEGDTFTAKGLASDTEAIGNFYDTRGHLDVTQGGKLRTRRVPNPETGTMDLVFSVDEGQKSYIEKITIRGNTITKDKVIRRELAVSPGEVFDMTRVKLSKRRLQGLEYFSKVEARPEDTLIPNRKDLLIDVEEQRTGKLQFGAGFSSIDSLVGYVEVTQGNFDLFHPPTFRGGGQKFRAQLQVGTERQDYVLELIEPWFLDRYLSLGTKLYHQRKNYQSIGNLYDEARSGMQVTLSKALPRPVLLDEVFGPGQLIGSVYFNPEQVGILLDDGVHGTLYEVQNVGGPFGWPQQVVVPPNAPNAILSEGGYTVLTKVGTGLAYDTRNDSRLPNGGQRTELNLELATSYLGGERDFYRMEFQTAWYFPGFFKGHVLEVGGRAGVTEGLDGDTVPFYERYYLGGMYSLRGTKYRAVSPREPGFLEPIGGHNFWFGTAEYSLPIIEAEGGVALRFAMFYDIGSVGESPYSFNVSEYTDNWGFGIRLNIPQLGPLRLDYGIPINFDQYSNDSGKFHFGVGWQRPF